MRKSVESLVRRGLYGAIRLLLRNAPLSRKLKQSELRSLLIIPYGDAIGDLIVASPLWRAVKRRVPNCKIGVFSSTRNESLLRADPDVDEQYHFAGRADLRNWRDLLRARRDQYQVILNLHFVHQSDYGIFANVLGRRAIKATGWHPRKELYSIFFNHIGTLPRHKVHLSQLSLHLLSEIVEFDPPLTLEEARPSIVIPDKTRIAVREGLDGLGIAGKYIILHQQAATPFREWGFENSLALAERLIERYPDRDIVLTGSTALVPVMQALPRSQRINVWPSSGDLLELAALIEAAELVVTPETSIAHFCTACRTPVVLLIPDRGNLAVEWFPLAVPSRLLAPDVRTQPVETISVDRVFEAATTLLDGVWIHSQTSVERAATCNPVFQEEHSAQLLDRFLSQQ